MADQHSNSTINQSVYCAFEIVNYLAGRGWCRVKDISAALGIDSAKVHRILKPMILLNYIEYNAKTAQISFGNGVFFHILSHDQGRIDPKYCPPTHGVASKQNA